MVFNARVGINAIKIVPERSTAKSNFFNEILFAEMPPKKYPKVKPPSVTANSVAQTCKEVP